MIAKSQKSKGNGRYKKGKKGDRSQGGRPLNTASGFGLAFSQRSEHDHPRWVGGPFCQFNGVCKGGKGVEGNRRTKPGGEAQENDRPDKHD